ncbi:hypothetical protein BJF85_19045 [Saccharomonospora sp. CUA-673]|uniref:hypothetical protein n=1 Tax=Saccharomonospora sp. CUA-673 TaxID=1904969 RepID=UPI0009596622|nr:hypothetical protein [Saccharomonospora sp. CUA-673]OLT45465.1 hypothetical protein BJF85_19045 [Saccharomonospora sp. CUA-673]
MTRRGATLLVLAGQPSVDQRRIGITYAFQRWASCFDVAPSDVGGVAGRKHSGVDGRHVANPVSADPFRVSSIELPSEGRRIAVIGQRDDRVDEVSSARVLHFFRSSRSTCMWDQSVSSALRSIGPLRGTGTENTVANAVAMTAPSA